MEINHLIKILKLMKKRNIAIIGHMGSGKTIFGKKLAKYYNIKHLDIDYEITKHEESTINNIFLNKGEVYFRKIESIITLNNLNKKDVVISLGGGSILNKKIRFSLHQNSYSIFLDTDINTLQKRLKASKNRPLLKGVNILTKMKELDAQRRKHYLQADLILNNVVSVNKTLKNFINIISSTNV